jgi:predicted house-cleaning noncanonical NTP pyrophosphatase (MazG superfamily)
MEMKLKAIRDKLGETPFPDRVYGRLSSHAFTALLCNKLGEESEEFVAELNKLWNATADASLDHLIEEVGDILDVVDALITYLDLDRADIQESRAQKHDERGGFSMGYVMVERP